MGDVVALPPAPSRAQIFRLEREMQKHVAVEIQPVHYFAQGLYAREITIPAGTLLTGLIHRKEHLNIVSKGDITVWTEHGMKRVQAPFAMVSLPGTKRVGYAHEDTVWTTIHACSAHDMAEIEAELVIPLSEQIVLEGDEVTQIEVAP